MPEERDPQVTSPTDWPNSTSLTAWWEKLHHELKKVAPTAGVTLYPSAALVKDPSDITVQTMSAAPSGKWFALYKMACHGALIESTGLMSLSSVATTIAETEPYISKEKPTQNSTYTLPVIEDDESLLFAMMYYRHLKRFQQVKSTKPIVQNGALVTQD